MLTVDSLKEALHQAGLSQNEKALLVLSCSDRPLTIAQIKEMGLKCGLKEIQNWNLGRALKQKKYLTRFLPEGWELTNKGKEKIIEIISKSTLDFPIIQTAPQLNSLINQIDNKETKAFLSESIKAYEYKLYRSAIVLSWVGAVSVLQDYVISNCLERFNQEAQSRNSDWRFAKNRDGLSLMKEAIFLQTLQNIGVIGKNVKQELEKCLTLRNGCGHPNSLQIGDHIVTSHIETLILNVFTTFA